MHLLLVDDDADFLTTLATGLELAGCTTLTARSGEEAVEALAAQPRGTVDAVLLDLQMPGLSGFDVLSGLREAGDEVPVIVVSSLDATETKVKGLGMGADDYLTKPVDVDELHARIEAVVRRRQSLAPLVYGELEMDLARRRVDRAGTAVDLTPREFDLLYVLATAKGEVRSRDELLRDVWGIEFDPETNLLDVHLGRLRRKLDRTGRPIVKNVRGQGYRLEAHTPED